MRERISEAPIVTRSSVQIFRKSLCQPVGDRLDDNRRVIVVLGFKLLDELGYTEPSRDGKRTDVIDDAGVDRRNEIGERSIGFVISDHFLLTEHREARHDFSRTPRFDGRPQDDVVAIGVGRPEAIHAARANQLAINDLPEQLLSVIEELLCGLADLWVVEDLRKPSFELPRREEKLPIDERHELFESDINFLDARE